MFAALTILKNFWAWLVGTPTGRIVLLLLVLGCSHWYTYHLGKTEVQDAWDAVEKHRIEVAEREGKILKDKQDKIVADLEKQIEDLKKAEPIIKTIIKEVPKYVTKKADSQCVLTSGFEWVYNESLEAAPVADSAPRDVDAPTGLKISEVASTSASNNAECTARGKIIDLWQEWYLKNQKAYEEYRERLQ